MRKAFFTSVFLLFCFASSAQQIKTFLNYATFYSPQNGPYIETYMSIIGGSLHYVLNEEEKYQATVAVEVAFLEEDSVILQQKYNLLSPAYDHVDAEKTNFIDQQRFLLKNGKYTMKLSIGDAHVNVDPYVITEAIEIAYQNEKPMLSDIELIESYKKAEAKGALTKSGVDMVPYVANFYPENFNRLSFYIELYNINTKIAEGEQFMFNYYIESYENKSVMSQFNRFSKKKPEAVSVLLGEFSLKELPSGNYNLVIEVKDKANASIIKKKAFFQRRNPGVALKLEDIQSVDVENTFVQNITEFEELKEHTKSLRPIAADNERIFIDNQLRANQFELMQQFFYGFWVKRNPEKPEGEWKKYYEEVKKVNEAFSTNIMKGYETDRGRVYLQYGPPDTRSEIPSEPSAYPYEIWHYYQLKNQSNRRFVFCDQEFSTNNYVLIHSDAIGEIRNERWQYRIHRRNTGTYDPDATDTPDHFGDKAKEIFDNPY